MWAETMGGAGLLAVDGLGWLAVIAVGAVCLWRMPKRDDPIKLAWAKSPHRARRLRQDPFPPAAEGLPRSDQG